VGPHPPVPTPVYDPTPDEVAAAVRVGDKVRAAKGLPRYEVTRAGHATRLAPEHPAEEWGAILLTDALGVSDPTSARGLLHQIADVARAGGEVTTHDLNFMLSVIRGLGPRDDVEALLAVQMAAVHNATMAAARRLALTATAVQQDLAANLLSKLARTFAAQVETLKKHRATGAQTITVQHVTVRDCGQAIVGAVHASGGGAPRIGETTS
jgi:hypothetical protein